MSRLFKDHTELLTEFSQFLPGDSPEASGAMLAQSNYSGKDVRLQLREGEEALLSPAGTTCPPATEPPPAGDGSSPLDVSPRVFSVSNYLF